MTLEPPKIIQLDQIEPVPGPGSLTNDGSTPQTRSARTPPPRRTAARRRR
jgi:hypothetical protein